MGTRWPGTPLRFLESLRTAGDIVRVDLGRWPVYLLTTPELVREALLTQAGSLARGRIYDRARILFGDGLATSEGQLHLRQRRLVQPAFQHRRITGYAEIMSDRADELVASLRPGQRIALDKAMHELTLGIVVSSLFSADLGTASAAEVQRLMPVVMNGIAMRMITPRRLDNWPIPVNRRFDRAAARLRGVVDGLIAAYRAEGRPVSGSGRGDLLSLLLDARDADSGDSMTDTQVCDEVVSLLLAGTETPANTLVWTFHELAAHPEVERALHAEIDEVVGDAPIGFDIVGKLPYTRRVLEEVLRLHPVLLFTRRATAATTLGGVHIPCGTEVAYSPYALHRDPVSYPEPTRFDPDRWLVQRPIAHAGHSFTPFGAGRHKCIGDAFAWTEMTIIVATIARRLQLRPPDGRRVREVVAEVPRPAALPMIVHERRRNA